MCRIIMYMIPLLYMALSGWVCVTGILMCWFDSAMHGLLAFLCGFWLLYKNICLDKALRDKKKQNK